MASRPIESAPMTNLPPAPNHVGPIGIDETSWQSVAPNGHGFPCLST